MAERFEEQGGFSTMDPHPLLRFISSKVITRMVRPETRARRRDRAEAKRRRRGAPHTVTYFHQVDDGYSHLAAQALRPLLESYEIELDCRLVSAVADANMPEPELLLALSRRDAAAVAPHYGLEFPNDAKPADAGLVERATRILAATDAADFPGRAAAVGRALWRADAAMLDALAAAHGMASPEATARKIEEGNALRRSLGHYSSAMFHYGDEWYWGVDRLYHLEARLASYGARRTGGEALLYPRPAIETGPLRDDGSLTFEIYPSLRSPYTAIAFDPAVDLAERTGVRLSVRPVLPMVMRGAPVTRVKGFYIMTDVAREAPALGARFGPFYDPIGQPVRNAYSLYPWARTQGRGNALLSSFMHRAFFEGVNTNREAGLRSVVEQAGLDWAEARAVLGSREWEGELEANRLEMYAFGSWGVPSFRLLDERGQTVLALWGQDRLWLFSREIQRLLRERGGSD